MLTKERKEKVRKKKSLAGTKRGSVKSQALTSMEKLGIWVSGVNRYEILNILYRVTKQYDFNPDVVRSARTVIEAKSFVWKGGTKPEHEDDNTDDTLFGLAYAWYVKSKLLGENLEKFTTEDGSVDTLKILSQESSNKAELFEAMFGNDVKKPNDLIQKQQNMEEAKRQQDEKIKTEENPFLF